MFYNRDTSNSTVNRHIEFFAGIGGVRIGLAPNWHTTWATDIDPLKKAVYEVNDDHKADYLVQDIRNLQTRDIPDAELASATFPCTNTSCAGDKSGLLGIKSGVVYRYLSKIKEKGGATSIPMTLLENPTGLIARNKGADLRDLVQRLNSLEYSVALTVVDAKHFVPQSRPRIFISSIERSLAHANMKVLSTLSGLPSDKELYPNPLRAWLSNNLDLDLVIPVTPTLPTRIIQLIDVLDLEDSNCDSWATPNFERELIGLMTEKHRATFRKMLLSPEMLIATVARRGRKRTDGTGFNATELSLSGLAPCQRPYKGGSSRTWVLVAGKGLYRFKVITPRESARLMGFDDGFILPLNSKDAYQATGDSVAPQAIRWVDEHIFQPIIRSSSWSMSSGQQFELQLA